MYGHSCALAIAPHWRVHLGDAHLHLKDLRVSANRLLRYPASDMLEQRGRDFHLSLDNLVEFGVTDSILYAVGLHGCREVDDHIQVDRKESADLPFLRHNTMKGIEP